MLPRGRRYQIQFLDPSFLLPAMRNDIAGYLPEWAGIIGADFVQAAIWELVAHVPIYEWPTMTSTIPARFHSECS